MNAESVDNDQNATDVTWKEHNRLFRQAILSWRLFAFAFVTSIILVFTVGIVFQVVFLFSFLQASLMLAMLSQPFYSALLFILKDERLPRTLPKPPLSAYLSSIIPLLISIFFLFIGIIVFQKTGFCAQSMGCIFVTLIRSTVLGH